MNTDKTITRSTGIKLTGLMGIAAAGRVPGGGVHGKTEALDAIVAKAAEALACVYGCGVEIRFNSDQKSGGAFLKGQPCSIGITAKLWDIVDSRAYIKSYPGMYKGGFAEYCREQGLKPKGKRYQITLSVYIGHGAMKDPAFANCWLEDGERSYVCRGVGDIEAGLAMIGAHAKLAV